MKKIIKKGLPYFKKKYCHIWPMICGSSWKSLSTTFLFKTFFLVLRQFGQGHELLCLISKCITIQFRDKSRGVAKKYSSQMYPIYTKEKSITKN